MFEYSIVCCARWEAPYIGEWIRYYDTIGFDRIYIYCNDDDPELLQAEVERAPKSHCDLVEFVHFQGQGQQRAMYLDALQKVRREAAWVAFLDVDEFLFLPGCQNIKSFMLDRQATTDSIHFHWLNFGNSGFTRRPSGNVLPRYIHRAAHLHQNTKHLSRVSLLDEDRIAASHHPFWHGLFDPAWSDLRRASVLGDDMGELVVDLPTRLRAYLDDPARMSRILETAVVNHYMIKSEEDFNIRAARGLKGEFSGQSMWRDQYNSGNYKSILATMNSVEDTRMRDFARACGWDETPGQASGPVKTELALGAAQPAGALRAVQFRHTLWTAELVLGSNGRARHSEQGTLGSYKQLGDVIYLYWDEWPPEAFVKSGDVFVSMLASPQFPLRAV